MDIATYKIKPMFSIPVIDVESTSEKLKRIRINKNITVANLQKIFNMENPQSIYNWENPQKKILPRLDNLVVLAKLYKVSIDELIVIKTMQTESLPMSEAFSAYGLTKETLDFIRQNASENIQLALSTYFDKDQS